MSAIAEIFGSSAVTTGKVTSIQQPVRTWFHAPQTATMTVSQQHLTGRQSVHFRKVVEAQLTSCGALVLDCSRLQTLDSAAISTLIQCWQAAQKTGRSISLSGVSKQLLGILQLVRLDELFPVAA